MSCFNSEEFGRVLVQKLRETSIAMAVGIFDQKFDSPGHREYQKLCAEFDPTDRERILDLLEYCIDGGINDFLYELRRTHGEHFDEQDFPEKYFGQWLEKYRVPSSEKPEVDDDA